jgi:hypothetical protein
MATGSSNPLCTDSEIGDLSDNEIPARFRKQTDFDVEVVDPSARHQQTSITRYNDSRGKVESMKRLNTRSPLKIDVPESEEEEAREMKVRDLPGASPVKTLQVNSGTNSQ